MTGASGLTRTGAAVALVLGLGLATVPFWATGYVTSFLLLLLMYMGLALSWNLVSGLTGYVSFGHAAFFGVGAYAAAILITKAHWHWLPASLAGGCLAAALALPVGAILLRLKGAYFAVSMLGLAEILRYTASQWSSLTGGGNGVYLPPVNALTAVYFAMFGVTAAVFALTAHLLARPVGVTLRAIRDDELATRCLGVDTTRLKVFAFVLSAFFPGILGGLYGWYVSYIEPDSVFSSGISLNMLVMTFFGGAGTLWGPVIGATVLQGLEEYLWARLPALYMVIFGLLVVLNVLAMPGGIVAYARIGRGRMARGGVSRWAPRFSRSKAS